MARGGYKIVDLKGENLSSTGGTVKIPGVYEAIEGNFYKPLMVCNARLDSQDRTDFFTAPSVESGQYVLPAYGGKIKIGDDDTVSYSV